jgi:hypothetical protein
VALQILAAVLAIVSAMVDDDGYTTAAFWISFVLIEAALTTVALTIGSRGFAMLGVVVGIGALSLFAVHSFASVAVAGAATVLSFGAALVPRRGDRSPSDRLLGRRENRRRDPSGEVRPSGDAATPSARRCGGGCRLADERRERSPSRDAHDYEGLQCVDGVPVKRPIRCEGVLHVALHLTEDRLSVDHAGKVPLSRTETRLIEVLPDAPR